MIHRATVIPLLALAAHSVTLATCRAASDYQPPDCGTNVLFLLMRLEGAPAGLAEIEHALPQRRELGYSLLELQLAARRCGLRLVGESFGPANAPLRSSVIAYRPGHKPASGHFVLLRPVGANNTVVQVIDPPYAAQIIDYPALFGNAGRPVMILRPIGRFERWAPVGWIILLALPCAALAAKTYFRHRPARIAK
jgi:hypothetical protein